MTEIKNVVVVGAGAMGSQIGIALRPGRLFFATVTDIALRRAGPGGHIQLRQRMGPRYREEPTPPQEEVDAAFGRLTFSTDLDGAASTADFVVEAAVEKLDVKRAVVRPTLIGLRRRPRFWPPTRPASCRPGSRTRRAGRTGSATCTFSIPR